MIFDKKVTFAAESQTLLTDQFKKDVMLKVAEAFALQVQDLETLSFDLLAGRGIDTAVGVQLDGIGENVGSSREGLDDAAYRIRVKARIALNLASGTPNEIITILKSISGSNVKLTEYYPANFVIDTSANPALTVTEAAEMARIVASATAAGVRSQFIYSLAAPLTVFRFSASNVSETNPNKGFANAGQTTGGKLAGVTT